MELQTERTVLRPLEITDANFMFELNLNHEVLKYTGDVPFVSINEARLFLRNYRQFELYRTGRFVVLNKISGVSLGWCGLSYSPDLEEYDLGFRFFQQEWGKGYASETSLKCLQYGFENLNLDSIVGRARYDNAASIAVLAKIGMKFQKPIDFDGLKGQQYSISKEEYYKSNNLS